MRKDQRTPTPTEIRHFVRKVEAMSLPSYKIKLIAEKMAELKNDDVQKQVLQHQAQQIINDVASKPTQQYYSAGGLLLIAKLLKDKGT